MVASLIKDFKAANPNGFWFISLTTVKRFTTRRRTKLRGVTKTTRRATCTPFRFLLWTSEKWQATHPRDFSQDVDRKYSLAELIHTWSDLAGLSYDGYDPTRSVVNPQFKETTRWIGNPYKKNALIDYDTLPYGDQVGNQ